MKKHFSSYWIRSAFYTILQRFSLTLFGFINFAILARKLSHEQMGVWALFLIVTSIFETTKSNLLKNAHIKFVSASDDTKERTAIASSSFLINAMLNIFFIILILLFSDWLGRWLNTNELATMLKWFIPGLVFMTFFSHFEAVQQSHLDFKGGFAGYFVRQAAFFVVIGTYALLHKPLSIVDLVMYQSGSIALGAFVLFLFSKKYLLYQFKASKAWVKRIISYGSYIFGSGMMANVCANLDQIMIGRFMNPASVAYYSVATRINNFVDIPSYAASEVIFPKASRASIEEGKEKVKYLFEKMCAVLIAFTVPTALFIIAFPRLMTTIISGRGYGEAALILQLYMITGIFRPVQNQAANLLNSIGKPGLTFFINACFLLTLLGMNYICLLQFGFYGAAIGTLITSMLGFIAWYFVMRKEIDFDIQQVVKYTLDVYKSIFKKLTGFFSKTEQSAA